MDLSKFKRYIEKKLIYLATSDNKGRPNLITVMYCKLIGKNQILVTDNFMNKTRKNLLQNNKISVVCGAGEEWYQLKGTAKYLPKGKWKNIVKAMSENKGLAAKAAVLITIKEGYNLGNCKKIN
jgi:predicted pyridoxine 5'-phosphate oxidase superfamily flavin-nucleotide-binding protein